MAKQDIDFRAVSNANGDFWCIYCITDTTTSDKP